MRESVAMNKLRLQAGCHWSQKLVDHDYVRSCTEVKEKIMSSSGSKVVDAVVNQQRAIQQTPDKLDAAAPAP